MAITNGVNSGFVFYAPTADPAGTNGAIDTYSAAQKVTTPAYPTVLTEIGWYCDNATEAANFDVGIYTHDVANNRPDAIIGAVYTVAKGTDAGWKKKSGLYIRLNPSTIYWIGVQVDDTATNTLYNYTNDGVSKEDYKTSQTSLPSSWGASSGSNTYILALYALLKKYSHVSTVSDTKIY